MINALATTVIARNASASDQVSISMGALEIASPYTEERRVRLTNKGSQPVTLKISASNTVGVTAARMVPLRTQVTLSAGQEESIPFRFEANPVGVGDDPTTADIQGTRFRPKMPEASGQLWFEGGRCPSTCPGTPLSARWHRPTSGHCASGFRPGPG